MRGVCWGFRLTGDARRMPLMRPRVLALVALGFVAGLGVALRMASAQVATGATPVYHGILRVKRATGSIDRDAHGSATLRVRRWELLPTPDTNGLFPAEEVINVAVGEDALVLPAASLQPSRNGKVFVFHSRDNRIRLFRLWQLKNGAWAVRFTLAGVDLSRLMLEDPVCLPVAVLVGDDDGFTGGLFSSPSFFSRRLTLERECDVGGDWPWLRG